LEGYLFGVSGFNHSGWGRFGNNLFLFCVCVVSRKGLVVLLAHVFFPLLEVHRVLGGVVLHELVLSVVLDWAELALVGFIFGVSALMIFAIS
jgi:hypothetical protein